MSNNIYLKLGCFGYVEDSFVSCKGCENVILTISEDLDNYEEIMQYFDACRLFDKPLFEFNSVNSFVKNMQSKFDQVSVGQRLWSERKYHLYQKFIIDHRLCGNYVKLSFSDIKDKDFEEKRIKVPSLKEEVDKNVNKQKKLNLKLIRNRGDV